MTAPRAIAPFLSLAAALRARGFTVAPDQTIGFLQAVDLLGPRDIGDVRQAALALFAIPQHRREEFEAVFLAVFFGRVVAAPSGKTEDATDVMEVTGRDRDAETDGDETDAGQEAASADIDGGRLVAPADDDRLLARFAALAPARLPRRRALRRVDARRGDRLDLRRTLRGAGRFEGELFDLHFSRRRTRQRRIVFLIDVSGSMQAQSGPALRMAHRLVQSADHAEVFSLGTRLTRLTPALRLRAPDLALKRASTAVSDFDGGTRLGDALWAFLAVPRYAGHARGAWVVMYSDGLERDHPARLVAATERLSRLSWQFSWLTPLGPAGAFRPETAALKALMPAIDTLAGAPDLAAVSSHFLSRAHAG